MAKGFFITGTDTGIGKTSCAVGILQQLSNSGFTTTAMKPVASGAEKTSAGLRNSDALQLMKAATLNVAYDTINPYCFATPTAPHIAALLANTPIELGRIQAVFSHLSKKVDYIVVEGVGGWRVPFSDTCTSVDLAQLLALPVILVVGIRLGCLNHSMLTAQAIQQASLPLTGWIANSIDAESKYKEENIAYLKRHIQAPLLGTIPHIHSLSRKTHTDYINLQPIL